MRIRITCLLISVFFLSTGPVKGQAKLKNTKVTDNITMKIPGDFLVMSEQDMWQRSSSYRKATALYTDPNRVVELAINNAFARWEEGDIRLLQNMYKASIQQIFDEVDWINEEIKNVNGRDFAVFEFVSKIKGDPGNLSQQDSIVKYYYIQYTIIEGGTMVFNFSCLNYVQEDWQETAGAMMNSVKIK